MSKFKVGEPVVTNEFRDNQWLLEDSMSNYFGKPGYITSCQEPDNLYYIHGYWWPESALTLYEPKPQYDLKEFVLAALTGLCANSDGVMTEDNRRSFHPNDISKVAVEIAKTTIWALKKENGQVTVREAEEHAEMEEKKPMYIENCTLEDAKRFWNNGQKLTAVKIVKVRKNCLLSQAKKYCEDYF